MLLKVLKVGASGSLIKASLLGLDIVVGKTQLVTKEPFGIESDHPAVQSHIASSLPSIPTVRLYAGPSIKDSLIAFDKLPARGMMEVAPVQLDVFIFRVFHI